MPQLDIFTFGSQIFWVTAIFWGLYVIVFSSFIFPFSFISKVRAYLSITIFRSSSASTNSKFSFDSSYNNVLAIVTLLSSDLHKHLSESHFINLESISSLVEGSTESFFEETEFSTSNSYVFLKISKL